MSARRRLVQLPPTERRLEGHVVCQRECQLSVSACRPCDELVTHDSQSQTKAVIENGWNSVFVSFLPRPPIVAAARKERRKQDDARLTSASRTATGARSLG